MRIVVFGATGGTGREIVSQALIRGDEVAAFVRDPSSVEPASRLAIVQGDVLDAAAVDTAVRGKAAVVSALGTRGGESTDAMEHGMRNIITAMQSNGVRRIVMVSTAGAEALTHQRMAEKLVMRTAASTILRGAIADAIAQERLLEQSDLDYTIVRAPLLTDSKRSGSYRVEEDGLPAGATSISRGDVAEFMLMQLDSDKWIKKRPYIGA